MKDTNNIVVVRDFTFIVKDMGDDIEIDVYKGEHIVDVKKCKVKEMNEVYIHYSKINNS